jgi:hypothetical protein
MICVKREAKCVMRDVIFCTRIALIAQIVEAEFTFIDYTGLRFTHFASKSLQGGM